MKQHERDKELTNTSPRPFPSKEPNSVTLQAIHEGDAFLATGESGCFDNSADLIDAALANKSEFCRTLPDSASLRSQY